MAVQIRTILACFLTAAALCAQHDPQHRGVDTQEALRLLKLGNERFVRGESLLRPIDEGTRRSLTRVQRPYAIIVTTADSRLSPELIFNAGLGELYTIRVAGNVCDPATLASIEFGAQQLGIELCIVLGHDEDASLKLADSALPASPAGERLHDHLASSLRWAARQGFSGEQRLRKASEENVYMTIQNALHKSSTLRMMTASERFEFIPARYENDTGRVAWLPQRRMTTYSTARPEATEHRPARVRGFPPHVAMRMLHAGHRRFLSKATTSGDISPERRKALLEGQRPHTVVVADADSRVSPEILFDAGLGELYVIRVAGNFLDDEVLASIEHAVENTGASLVVVLGHDKNDVVELAAASSRAGGSVETPASMRELFQWLEPSIVQARGEGLEGEALVHRAVEVNCTRFLESVRSRSELLRRAEDEGFVAMFAGFYEIASGDLRWLEQDEARGESAAHRPAVPHGENSAVGHDAEKFAHGLDAHAHDDDGHHDHHAHHDDHGSESHTPHGESGSHRHSEEDHGEDTHGHGAHFDLEEPHGHPIENDGFVTPDSVGTHGPDSLLPTLLGSFAIASLGVAMMVMVSNSRLRRRLSILVAAINAQSERQSD